MRKTVLALAILLSLTASAQNKWSLKQCLEYALANNVDVKLTKLAKKTAIEERKQANAQFLPSLSASTRHNLDYEPWIDAGMENEGSNIKKTAYNANYGIDASWTVWNGNINRNQLRRNKLAEEVAELDIEETCNSLQEEVAKLYIQILYTYEAIAVNEQSLEASKKNEERGREMLEVGRMSKAQLAQLTAQRAKDEYNVVEAKTNLAKYKMKLKQLLKLTGDNTFDIVQSTAPDQQALADIPTLKNVFDQAMLLRPEIKSAEKNVKQKELQIKIARGGYLPQVSLKGSLGTSTFSDSEYNWGLQMKRNVDLVAGVAISIPIFDNRLNKTAVNKAKIAHETALLLQEDEKDELYNTIEGYWLDAQNNQQKFRAAVQTVESEQESYDLLSEQFNLGLKNVVDLMVGKASLLKAQQNKLQSKYLTILAIQLMKFYQGEALNI